MVTAETYQIFYPCKKSISRSFEKFPFLVVPRNVIMSQHLIIQFPFYYLSSGHLWEVENKRKFQTFSSTSGCSRLREVPNVVTWFGNFWYFGKLIIEGEVVTHERVRHNRKSWTTYMYMCGMFIVSWHFYSFVHFLSKQVSVFSSWLFPKIGLQCILVGLCISLFHSDIFVFKCKYLGSSI